MALQRTPQLNEIDLAAWLESHLGDTDLYLLAAISGDSCVDMCRGISDHD